MSICLSEQEALTLMGLDPTEESSGGNEVEVALIAAVTDGLNDGFNSHSLNTHMHTSPKQTLTSHPHCCGRRRGKGQTCQRNPFYPACWRRAAWSLCPGNNNRIFFTPWFGFD